MSNEGCIWKLNNLLEENQKMVRLLKRTTDVLEDPQLKNYFQQKISQWHKFSMEISEGIKDRGGAAYFDTSHLFNRNHSIPHQMENHCWLLKKNITALKSNLKKYRKTLSLVNDGMIREILIRHKSLMEKTVLEIKTLKRQFPEEEDRSFLKVNQLKNI